MSDPSPWSPPPVPPGSATAPPPPYATSAAGGDFDTRSGAEHATDRPTIGPGPAALGWLITWILANVASTLALLAYLAAVGDGAGSIADGDPIPLWGTITALIGQWAVTVGGVVLISNLFGTGNLVRDYGIKFAPIDLTGVLVGLAGQFLLLPLLYLPLRSWWPETFSNEKLDDRAKSLVADNVGVGLVVLVLCVALLAPVIEEVAFRGLLQRSLQRPLHRVGAWILVSAIFAGVHLTPIEFPGLFVAGLIFGLGVLFTNRIGFGIAAHFAFNASAMAVLVATR